MRGEGEKGSDEVEEDASKDRSGLCEADCEGACFCAVSAKQKYWGEGE